MFNVSDNIIIPKITEVSVIVPVSNVIEAESFSLKSSFWKIKNAAMLMIANGMK